MKYKNVTMKEEIVRDRIKENETLFTKEDLKIIEKSFETIKKIYLIGLINGREIYGKNLQ